MVKGKLKGLKVGESKTITTKNGRRVTFKRIAKIGFPQFRIVKNTKR